MPGLLLGELLVGSFDASPPDTFGGCRWPLDYSCCQLPDDTPDNLREAVEAAAIELAWSLSGRQFGSCQVPLRPCAARCDAGGWSFGMFDAGWSWSYPVKVDGQWLNLACGSCVGECSCGPVERVVLPNPITVVDEVRIDGVVLASSAYRVDGRRTLVRQDGGRWPRCQRMDRAAGEPGTWTVTARYGREVPALGELSAAEIACEQLKFCSGDKTCQIPSNWSNITRAGLSISRSTSRVAATASDLDTIPEEWLPWTRRFLRAFNPHSLQAPSTVWSPDIPQPARTF